MVLVLVFGFGFDLVMAPNFERTQKIKENDEKRQRTNMITVIEPYTELRFLEGKNLKCEIVYFPFDNSSNVI